MSKKEGRWVDPTGDRGLRESRTRLLAKYVPAATTRRIMWSGGTTELIEMGDGPPLVMLHGGLGQATDWTQIMPMLAARYHLYVPDRPGHGLSDPFDYEGIAEPEVSSTFTGEVLDNLGLEAAPLVGNSMGGFCAISFCLRNPLRVPQLILPGMPAGLDRFVPKGVYEAQKLLRTLSTILPGALIRAAIARSSSRKRMLGAISGLMAHPERVSEEHLDCLGFNMLRNHRSLRYYLDGIIDQDGVKLPMLLESKWSEIRVPTTFIWGEKDRYSTVERGRAAAGRLQRGRFELIPDAGHLVWWDEPEKVAAAILGALDVAFHQMRGIHSNHSSNVG